MSLLWNSLREARLRLSQSQAESAHNQPESASRVCRCQVDEADRAGVPSSESASESPPDEESDHTSIPALLRKAEKLHSDYAKDIDYLLKLLHGAKARMAADNQLIQEQAITIAQLRAARNEEWRRRNVRIATGNLLETKTPAQEQFTEDELLQEMRALYKDLQDWVRRCFGDPAKLAAAYPPDVEFRGGNAQHQAWVQTAVACYVTDWIFWPYRLGIGGNSPWHCYMAAMEALVAENCSETMLQNWRMTNTIALDARTGPHQDRAFHGIIGGIERRFKDASTAQAEARQEHLARFLQRCCDFKNRLVTQKARYSFRIPRFRDRFHPLAMTHLGGELSPDAKVLSTIWPGLEKRHSNIKSEIVEPAVVWTYVANGSAGKGSDD
ncbi:hypothetical protein BJX64DRAFT_284013 [Aspergillus heterothallicus]